MNVVSVRARMRMAACRMPKCSAWLVGCVDAAQCSARARAHVALRVERAYTLRGCIT